MEEKYRPRHSVQPFRLHLLLVPTLSLPVVVRRGPRRYPRVLDWLLPAGRFASVGCPSCGRPDPLVAGKERLGCESCLPGRVPLPAPVSPPPLPARPAPAKVEGGATSGAPLAEALAGKAKAAAAGRGDASAESTGKPAIGNGRRTAIRPIPTSRQPGDKLLRAGEKLAMALWQSVAAGTAGSVACSRPPLR